MKVKAIDGKPIFDAKKAITINITPNDIAKADKKEPADCAVDSEARGAPLSLKAYGMRNLYLPAPAAIAVVSSPIVRVSGITSAWRGSSSRLARSMARIARACCWP